MKESTGGMLLMGLAAGIIMVFIILVAFFISYGKSFRLKNTLINKLEQSEGMKAEDIKGLFIAGNNAYNGKEASICYNRFFSGSEIIGFNYELIVYMEMDRTILGEVFNPRIPVKGETKVIEKGNYLECLRGNGCIGVDLSGSVLSGVKECSIGMTPVGSAS